MPHETLQLKGAHPSLRENPEWFLETSETPLKLPLIGGVPFGG